MKNRIAKLVEINKIEIFEEDLPKLKDNEILVKVKSVGICGSDMHYFKEGGLGSFKSKLPMPMGHEPSGVVFDSNKSKKFKNGDRVVIEPGMPCVSSHWSIKGFHNMCDKGTFMGANHPGAFADYVIVQDLQLEKIPDSMSFDKAALIEPLGVALHTYNLIKPKLYDSVTIFGSGPIGLCTFSVFEKAGIKEIFMVDELDFRVDFAKKFGASNAYNINEKNYINDIKSKTNNGYGTTFCIDTAGKDSSIDGCVRICSPKGKIALVGIPEQDYIQYNPHIIRTKELQLQNVRRSNQTMHDCLKLYNEDIKIEKIISHKFDFLDIQKAFELVAKYKDNVIKCMIEFN